MTKEALVKANNLAPVMEFLESRIASLEKIMDGEKPRRQAIIWHVDYDEPELEVIDLTSDPDLCRWMVMAALDAMKTSLEQLESEFKAL